MNGSGRAELKTKRQKGGERWGEEEEEEGGFEPGEGLELKAERRRVGFIKQQAFGTMQKKQFAQTCKFCHYLLSHNTDAKLGEVSMGTW